MDMIARDRSGNSPEDFINPSAANRPELDAAAENLNAAGSDLEQLLNYIDAKAVSRQQVPALLKQAYLRLKELRESRSDLTGLAEKEAEIAALINQADNALRSGEAFSLEDAEQALEKACGRCLELKVEPEIAALVRSRQAQIAAARQEYRRASDLYAIAAATPGLEASLQWQYQNRCALALEELGREFMENAALEEAIDLYEATLPALAAKEERRDDWATDWATTQNNLGTALGVLGKRQRGTKMLERSIEAFESALSERPRKRVPLDWAATQNNLGNALGLLGQRQADTPLLEKSIKAFESALSERSAERVPLDWATTQNNLGAVLHTLGAHQDGTKLLSKSVKAYKNVLTVWTREREPLNWATTLNNLGTVLRALGERQNGTRTLEKSVAAYKNALKVRTRERVPQDWAMTQNNLGATLQKLGECQEEGIPELEESVASFEHALSEWTRERLPMSWAMTMANLGAARKILAERADDIDVARKAVADFEAAVDVFRSASHAQYVELCEEQRTKAKDVLKALGGA